MIENDYTFDSFMLSRSNNISQLACKAAIDEPQNYSPVLLHGPTGCGKTHLLRASEAYAAALGKKTLYVTMTELISRVLTEEDLVPRLCEYQLILVDDASEIAGMDSTQTEAASLIHKLYLSGVCVIISCTDPLSRLSIFAESLKEYCKYRLFISISPPDKALIRQYFTGLCEDMGLTVTEDAVEHMASSFDGNLPILRGRFLTALTLSGNTETVTVDFLNKYFEF